jgi:hypothetical protein
MEDLCQTFCRIRHVAEHDVTAALGVEITTRNWREGFGSAYSCGGNARTRSAV